MSEQTVRVFHRWNADLDVEERTVTFWVSKEYAETKEDADTIKVDEPDRWDKVMVLPFPEENVGTLKDQEVTYAANPQFFDHTQLSKRFIPVDEFVQAVVRIMDQINIDLDKHVAMEKLSEDSEWSDIL